MEKICILTYGAEVLVIGDLVGRSNTCFADLRFSAEPTVCFST